MAALSAFYPFVAPLVPGAPDVAIEDAALWATIDFCGRTLALQRSLSAVNTVANQAEYTLTQAGEVVHKLLAVKLADEPLHLLAPSQLDHEPAPAPAERPWAALLTEPMKVKIYPTPSVSSVAIVARAAMRPAQTATTIADEIFERYAEVIAHGAAARLLLNAQQPYYDPNGSIAASQRFLDGVAAAKAAVFTAHARSAARPRVRWC